MNEPSVNGAGAFDDGLGHGGMSERDTSELRVATLEIAQIDELLHHLAGCPTSAPRPRSSGGNGLDLQLPAHSERLESAGGTSEVHVWEAMVHVFPSNVAVLRAATEALDDIADFLRNQLRVEARDHG